MASSALPDQERTDPAVVLKISGEYKARSWQARRQRSEVNDDNWDAYRGEQDYSYKASYQSQERTPSFPLAVDQVIGTFERSLTDSEDWLAADAAGVGDPFLKPEEIRGLLLFYLKRLSVPGNQAETSYAIQTLIGDCAQQGILEPSVTVKVYPVMRRRRVFRFKSATVDPDRGSLDLPAHTLASGEGVPEDVETMRLAVDLIPWEDYFPDPSPASRFEMQRTRVGLDELLANEDYDQDVIKGLVNKRAEDLERGRKRRSTGEASIEPPSYEIEVFEAWGDIIDENGEVLEENVFWTFAEGQLIRPPTPNPFWDGTRPFVRADLLRIKGSKEPRALADLAVPMWKALNDLFNLGLDGANRSVWGVGQVRADIMERPEEIADGIQQGYTAVLASNAPLGAKFYERVDSGEVPQLGLEFLGQTQGFINEALAVPDTRLGNSPDSGSTATETVQALKSSGSIYESFAARFEATLLEPVFEKAWRIILQYADDFLEDELVNILGPTNILRLLDMKPQERFRLLQSTHFRVRGLRGLASKERDFNKNMTLLNVLSQDEQLKEKFGERYSWDKFLDIAVRSTGIDPLMIALDEDPDEAVPEGDPEAEGLQEEAAAASAAALGPDSGGQLDPTLAGGSGASAPNISSDVDGQRGDLSSLAPQNPNAPVQ